MAAKKRRPHVPERNRQRRPVRSCRQAKPSPAWAAPRRSAWGWRNAEDISHMAKARLMVPQALRGRIARNAGYSVKVSIVAGELCQAVGLHCGDHQCIVAEQARLPADTSRGDNQSGVDGNDTNARSNDARECRLAVAQRLDNGRVLFEALKDFPRGPTVACLGFDSHQAVGQLSKDCGGGIARKLLVLNALDQLAARPAPCGVGGEVVHERVGVDENSVAGNEVEERHGSSGSGGYSNSGSRAK